VLTAFSKTEFNVNNNETVKDLAAFKINWYDTIANAKKQRSISFGLFD